MQFLQGVWGRLIDRFDPAALEAQSAALAGNAIVAFATFFVFYIAARVINWILPFALEKFGVDDTARSFTSVLVRLVVLTAGAVAALSELGVNTPALVTSMGVAGLTIGFAARDALSNVVSGLFIFWDRPFVLGDLIDFDGGHGRVDRISLRSTRVVTPDGKMISIPNSVLLNGLVTSYTNFPHLRLNIPVSVGTAEDLGRVRELLLQIVDRDPDFMDDPPPAVVVTELGDFNVTLELRAWLGNERQHLAKRPQLRERVFEALRSAGVDMPVETLAVHPLEVHTSTGRA